MRRTIKRLLLAVVAIMTCVKVSAYDVTVEGVTYSLNESSGTATIWGCEGFVGDLVIPSFIEGVKKIGNRRRQESDIYRMELYCN